MPTIIELPTSKLTKHQKKTYGPKPIAGYGPGALITAEVCHDDECGNGHNTFAITAEVVTPASKRRSDIEAGGCMHDEIAQAFPELAPFIKWHLTSTDGPMHYVANAKYWAGQSGFCDGKPGSPPNEAFLKSTIVFGAVPEHDTVDPMSLAKAGSMVGWLNDRLPALMEAFKRDVESLGFVY